MIEYNRIKYGVDGDGIGTRYPLKVSWGYFDEQLFISKERKKNSKGSHVYMQERICEYW